MPAAMVDFQRCTFVATVDQLRQLAKIGKTGATDVVFSECNLVLVDRPLTQEQMRLVLATTPQRT